MTHYTVTVQIPKEYADDWEKYLEDVLAPYDENISVPPYVKWSPEIARKEMADRILSLRTKIETDDNETYDLDYCKKALDELMAQTPDEFFKEGLRWYEKDSLDEDGNGLSTYNPVSKWDWYEIGGRWPGYKIKGGKDEPVIRVRDLDVKAYKKSKPLYTFAVITKNGLWQEPARMGWWAFTHDEKEDEITWESRFYDRFIKPLDPDDMLVQVDCHI